MLAVRRQQSLSSNILWNVCVTEKIISDIFVTRDFRPARPRKLIPNVHVFLKPREFHLANGRIWERETYVFKEVIRIATPGVIISYSHPYSLRNISCSQGEYG